MTDSVVFFFQELLSCHLLTCNVCATSKGTPWSYLIWVPKVPGQWAQLLGAGDIGQQVKAVDTSLMASDQSLQSVVGEQSPLPNVPRRLPHAKR